jgi:hypothetical protein
MAVGFPTKVNYATGDVLSATNMNDLSGTVNLLESAQYAAGKNKIINGDFSINQRAFTTTTTTGTYGFDRWSVQLSGATATYSAQTFTPGAAPVAGYEATNFARLATTVGNDFCSLRNRIEDVRTFAGQTVTLSFWAKGTNPTTLGGLYPTITQNFGSGGSTAVVLESATKIILTANWTRYSITFAIASISGKTIGTSSYLDVALGQGTNASTDAWTLDLWGVQLEAGSTASPFQTATGTIQGELAACQRYYWRASVPSTSQSILAMGRAYNTTLMENTVSLPVPMRIYPTTLDYANISMTASGTTHTSGTWTLRNYGDTNQVYIEYVHGSGVFTAGQIWFLATQATLAGYIGLSAEL